MKNILQYLERSAAAKPKGTAFADETSAISYGDLVARAKIVGSYLAARGVCRRPVALYLGKSVDSLVASFGVVYGGCFYAVLDADGPAARAGAILSSLRPALILSSEDKLSAAESLGAECEVVSLSEALAAPLDEGALASVRRRMIDTDPLYVLFTSGSTGIPKGAVVSHRSVISYASWAVDTFGFDSSTVFGNQTPLYFSMSTTDVYATVLAGAEMHLIPKKFFSFPVKLVDFLNERRVDTIYWVPSALSIVANFKLFDCRKPFFLKTVLFAGEIMPTRQLNYWIRHLPGVRFANLFGPTEVTDICAYYEVDRDFSDDEPLPIGRPCNNCDVFILSEDGREAAPGEAGELYVRGSFLADGYYNDPERTAAAFVQNPLNTAYPERAYRTGDLVRYNDRGELMYLGRRDHQIKHMGYRIELGEIETAINALPEIRAGAALYEAETDSIVYVYEGKTDGRSILAGVSKRLPSYMLPNRLLKIGAMKYNENGKIDRVWLKNNYKTL